MKVYVCEQAPELLKLLMVAHLGKSPLMDKGGLQSPSLTSFRIWGGKG